MANKWLVLACAVLAAPAALAGPGPDPTPPPKLLAKRLDDTECGIARYKLETDSPPPEKPTEVAELAEATTTFLDEQGYFNVTDACEGPKVTGDAGDAISSYLEAASSWSSEHACALSSIYANCRDTEPYSSRHLAPAVFCTKITEDAIAESECPSGATPAVAVRGVGAVAVAIAGAVVALMAS